MAHHVAVGEVHHNEVIFADGDGVGEFVGNLGSAHFGFEIIGGYLGRRHQDALFTLEGSFAATVEEECHVGIFLGLGDV